MMDSEKMVRYRGKWGEEQAGATLLMRGLSRDLDQREFALVTPHCYLARLVFPGEIHNNTNHGSPCRFESLK